MAMNFIILTLMDFAFELSRWNFDLLTARSTKQTLWARLGMLCCTCSAKFYVASLCPCLIAHQRLLWRAVRSARYQGYQVHGVSSDTLVQAGFWVGWALCQEAVRLGWVVFLRTHGSRTSPLHTGVAVTRQDCNYYQLNTTNLGRKKGVKKRGWNQTFFFTKLHFSKGTELVEWPTYRYTIIHFHKQNMVKHILDAPISLSHCLSSLPSMSTAPLSVSLSLLTSLPPLWWRSTAGME